MVLCVVDDGVGMTNGGRRSGLANLQDRAQDIGGEMIVDAPDGVGTRMVWQAPLAGVGDLGD